VRILIVTEYFWPESFRINDLASGLRARGHLVDVLTGMPNYPGGHYYKGYSPWGPFREDHLGTTVIRVPVIARGRGQGWRLCLNYLSFAVMASLRLLLHRQKAWDVSIVFQPTPITTVLPALLLRALKGTPVVTWVQDLWPETVAASGLVRAPWVLQAAQPVCNWIYRNCDRLLAQSEAYVPRLAATGIELGKVDYLPNWAEDLYSVGEIPAGLELETWAEGFPVMFAGNLGRVQALDVVLAAADRLRHDLAIRWVFVGDGVLRAWLETEVARRGLADHVHFLGRRPVDEMPRLFARAGAALVSLKRDEVLALTVPSKVQSYLAAGLPIIGSLDGEGARIINESGAGWATAAGDGEGLAESVRRMSALSPQQRAEMGNRGRLYAGSHFDRGSCLDRFERTLAQTQENTA
jgi:glycosyltransferase involved in cell wall biosynthesis